MIRRNDEMEVEVREKMRGGNGKTEITHLFKSAEFAAPVRLCAKMVLKAGSSVGLHEHATEDEVYAIVSGEGYLDEGNGFMRVASGDAILTGRGAKHSIENRGPDDLVLFAFIATYPESVK